MSKLAAYPTVVYLCFFLLLSAWAALQPKHTWDVVGYIGCSVDSSDPRDIHRLTYDAIRNVASAKGMLADNPYHADLAANPYHFAEQLPFYSIKPIYVLLIKGLRRLGVPFPTAAATVSAPANFALAIRHRSRVYLAAL